MKFFCPKCNAKYRIDDNKVAGRTLRMKCRQCGEEILIHEGMGVDASSIAPPSSAGHHVDVVAHHGVSLAPSAPHAHAAAGGGLWHAAINDVPVGPMSREELGRKIATGAVHPESLVWTEGHTDWRPAKEFDELRLLFRQAPSAGLANPRMPPPPLPAASALAGRGPHPTSGLGNAAASATAHAATPPGTRPFARSGINVPAAPTAPRPSAAGLRGVSSAHSPSASVQPSQSTQTSKAQPRNTAGFLRSTAEMDRRAPTLAPKPSTGSTSSSVFQKPGTSSPSSSSTSSPAFSTGAFPSSRGLANAGAASKVQEQTARGALVDPRREQDAPASRAAITLEVTHEALEAEAQGHPHTEQAAQSPTEPTPAVDAHTEPATNGTPSSAESAARHEMPEAREAEGHQEAPAPHTTNGRLDDSIFDFLPSSSPPAPLTDEAVSGAKPSIPALAPSDTERRASAVPIPPAIAPTNKRNAIIVLSVLGMLITAAVALVMVRQQPGTKPPRARSAQTKPKKVKPATVADQATLDHTGQDTANTEPQAQAAQDKPAAAARMANAKNAAPQQPAADPTKAHTASSKPSSNSKLSAEQQALLARMKDMKGGPSNLNQLDNEVRDVDSRRPGLNADQLRAVVSKNRPSLQRCYETAVRGTNQTQAIRLDINLAVSSAGHVTWAKAKGSEVGTIRSCLEMAVKKWRFPPSGNSTETSFPVVFQPGG
jgi:predicted Zn finger-like uncharacterized protein